MKKIFNKKNLISCCLVLAIVFSIIQLVKSAAPNPGHSWSEVGDEGTEALPVSRGGTGQTSLTANSVILGNDTNPVQLVAPGTAGNVLTSNGTTWQSAAPSLTSGAVVLLYANESGSAIINNNTQEVNLMNWNLNIAKSTYSYYILEAIVNGNSAANVNTNVNFTWRFKENSTALKNFNWRSISSNLMGSGVRSTATLKIIISNAEANENANWIISGQMSNANANIQMQVHSFRVYGVK